MLERAEPMVTAESTAAIPSRRDSVWLRGVMWLAITCFLLGMGAWAFRAGMELRDEVWADTRTIRLEDNIGSGVRFGTMVLRTAERVANSKAAQKHADPKSPALTAMAAPSPGAKTERPLTIWEILRGEDQVYQDMVIEQPAESNYPLDYPPLRLLAMTFWARHIENRIHKPAVWPGYFTSLSYSAKGDPAELVDENLARPILLFNTYSTAAAAVLAFFLVWLWINRGGRPNGTNKRLIPWKMTPVKQINGLAVFAISAWAFFYCALMAEAPAPAPPPAVALIARPILSRVNGTITATILASVDDQGEEAKCYVEYGPDFFYGKRTASKVPDEATPRFSLENLPANTTLHYRVSAINVHGITHSDDAWFDTSDTIAPLPPARTIGAVWIPWPLWIGIGVLLMVMACAIRILPPEHRGWAAGLTAALFIWFDPSVLMVTHVWPQWDAWVLPPFLLAALLASLDWWFAAGLVLGVGVMFKGQTMLAAPLLMVWPLFAGRIGVVARIVCGFLLSAGLVLSPWLVLANQPPQWAAGALRWIPAVLAAAVIAAGLSFYRRAIRREIFVLYLELRHKWIAKDATKAVNAKQHRPKSIFDIAAMGFALLTGIILITLLVLRRWPVDSEVSRTKGLLLLLAVLLPPWFLPRRSLGFWLAAILAGTLWLSPFLYHGDWSWKTIGFEYGTRRHLEMSLGLGNLPQILATRFGWDIHDTAITLRLPDLARILHLGTADAAERITGWPHDWGLDGTAVDIDIRQFLIAMFVLILLAAGAAAAVQSRRNDPRWLASIAALWVLMPCVLCQMQSRYAMWGAVMSAMLIGLSPGLTLLHVVLTSLATAAMASMLLHFDPSRSPRIAALMTQFMPDYGWIMLMVGLVFLYVAFVAAPRPSIEELEL